MIDLLLEVHGVALITSAVYQEAVEAGKKAGYADAYLIERYVIEGKVTVIELTAGVQEKLGRAAMPSKLGLGEKETIIEALEEDCLAILDDLGSRSVAAMLGLAFSGSDTVLLEALLKKFITLEDYESKISRLATVMGMRADDLAELLRLGRLIGEVIGNGNEDIEHQG